ncbi:MAG: 5-methyltetrahydropteroyltriglutamate--homocysteine S-methyltransferase, partial [Gemmatimonadales bacterium]
ALERVYAALAGKKGASRLLVQTYFGHPGDAFPALAALPVDGLGLDFVRGARTLELVQRHGWPKDKWLAAGVVDGRNVWVNDLNATLSLLQDLAERVGGERLVVQPSCSLLHVPIDVTLEARLDDELKSWLAFARQKLDEVVALTRALNEGVDAVREPFEANARALISRRSSPRTRNPLVRDRLASFAGNGAGGGYSRGAFRERQALQRKRLGLTGALPTTTIGSFPQTPEVRKARRGFRDGELDRKKYEGFIEDETRKVIRLQEEIGLDILVHGEFERNDMVEYFGEQLEGYAFSEHGWVQSYGSRYVKPPILFGDVHRPQPMTVRWSAFAQSCTPKPVKGMLTGPVTILQWSFVRDDQPRSETCRQLALAIRDEVLDLERAGLKVIQVDEPAIREGLPLRRDEWPAYLEWAVGCFRLATGGVRDETQIHTHMCYSEFGDMMDAVSGMDADVLLIENARSDAELLDVFRRVGYDKDVGPGIYDIHSPRVPSTEELTARLRAALEVLPPDRVWVNPDCGLKTRTYDECVPALKNLVAAARAARSAAGAVAGRG